MQKTNGIEAARSQSAPRTIFDEDILDCFFDRSEHAIRMAAEKYGAYCRSIAGNLLADERDAEECLNSTWFKAWNAIPPARPVSLKAYLGKIVRNEALNLIRRDGAEKRAGDRFAAALEELGDCAPSPDNPVEDAAGRGEISSCVNAFLSDQTPLKREMFVMRYFYLDSIPEIAQDLCVSESRVKTTLFRMRAGLRKKFIEKGLE